MADPVIIVDANGDEHEFPPGFDPKRAGAIVRQQTAPKHTAPPARPEDFTPAQPSALSRFAAPFVETARAASDAVNSLNPVQMALQGGAPLTRTLDRAKGAVVAQGQQFTKAGQDVTQGRYSEAAGHAAAGVLPVVGPAAAGVGEKIGSGDYAGAAGEGALLALPEVARVPAVRGGVRAVGDAAGVARAELAQSTAGTIMAKGAESAGAVAKAAVAKVADAPPFVKFIAAQQALTAMGVPHVVAEGLAVIASGYSHGKIGAVIDHVRGTAEPHVAGPVASPPVTPASPVVPGAPPPAPMPPAQTVAPAPVARPAMSPAMIRNEVGLAARRANANLSGAELDAADALVASGRTPVQAVLEVKAAQQAAAPAAKPKMTAAEMRVYAQLKAKGKTDAQAAAGVTAARELADRMGTPTVEEARQRMAELKATKYKN